MKFLLPLDGSSASRRAEDFAINLLNADSDTLYVLCVVEAAPIGELNQDDDEEGSTSIRSRITDEASLVVDDAANRLEKEGFPVTTEVAYGDAGESICEKAEENDVDSIIIGRQGKGQVEELLLGSVSNHVLTHSKKPVITVPSETV